MLSSCDLSATGISKVASLPFINPLAWSHGIYTLRNLVGRSRLVHPGTFSLFRTYRPRPRPISFVTYCLSPIREAISDAAFVLHVVCFLDFFLVYMVILETKSKI